MRSAATTAGGPAAGARAAHVLTLLALVGLQFLQSPGRTTFDTKLDLVVDPRGFLEGALHLWNPELSFGELQNQAYGYLFPQGAFFLVLDAAGVAPWVAQRLWSALVLVLAAEGARRLARAVAPDRSTWLPLVAGLAYALAPRTLGLSGVLSSEALPAAVLPWTVLPLVHVVSGRWGVVRGAALSGAAFLFVGGVNATAALAILPLPALVIACAGAAVPRLRLGAAWTVAVLVSSAWWLVPLVVLGRYSPPFLDVIETARATTGSLGWGAVLRGQDHWLFPAVVDGRPWWRGPYELATEPWLVAAATVVAAVSLVGLVHRRMPARTPLLGSALLGFGLLVVGHASFLGSPLAEPVRLLLDGPLAPLRNVHKVDPLVRLPLALGLAHGVGLLVGLTSRAEGVRRVGRAALLAAVAVAVVASAGPLLTGSARQPGWDRVPDAWRVATARLAVEPDAGRTWVVPGSGFGRQTWGWTIDEPIQPLARTPWVTRSQVPLVPPQTMRYLDALESRVADGRGSAGLADALARAGIGTVLLRHDLDVQPTSSPPADRVARALENSPGLSRVDTFADDDGVRLDLWRVDRDAAPVSVGTEASSTTLVGGPEDVVSALDAGVLPSSAAVVSPSDTEDPDVLADGQQRRERQFGRTLDALGPLLAADEPYRTQRRVHDHAGVPGVLPVTARARDGAVVTASSTAAAGDSLGPLRPELGPWAAVDGSPATMWRSGPLTAPRGQWLQVDLGAPRPVEHVDVVAAVDGFTGVPVRRVRVDAGGRAAESAVDPATGFARVRLSGAPVRSVRVTVTDVLGEVDRGVVSLREVTVPGVDLTREAVVPGAGAGRSSTVVLRAATGRRACVRGTDRSVARCDAPLARAGEEAGGLYRAVRTSEPVRWTVAGSVVAAASPATAVLLDPLGGAATVRATSVLADDPLAAAVWAHDGDPSTVWSSAPGDPFPSLTLTWPTARRVSSVDVDQPDSGTRRASRVRVEVDGRIHEVALDADGRADFPAARARELRITFLLGRARAGETLRPLTVDEVAVDGITDLRHRPDPGSRTGAPCGFGPGVRVDGQDVPTRVDGTIADVLDGRPLDLVPCGRLDPVGSGEHHVAAVSTAQFTVASLTLAPARPRPADGVVDRTTTVRSWEPTRRVVEVGPGDDGVLRVAENTNPGWRASLDGAPLEAVTVDGWQQGYRIPAGTGGPVVLEFTPDRGYRTGLLAGGVLALALLVVGPILLVTGRRHRRARVPGWRELPGGGRSQVGLALVAAAVGGVVVAVGVLVGLLRRRRHRPVLPVVTGLAALTATTAVTAALVGGRAPSWLADVLAGLVVGVAATMLLGEVRPSGTSPTQEGVG